MSCILSICTITLAFYVQSSSTQFYGYGYRYGGLSTGAISYSSIYPSTEPVYTSNAFSFGYKPQQRIDSIYSQLYHPEAAYVTNTAAQIRRQKAKLKKLKKKIKKAKKKIKKMKEKQELEEKKATTKTTEKTQTKKSKFHFILDLI